MPTPWCRTSPKHGGDPRDTGLRGARFRLALVGVFAGLALLLAAVGVYGAVAFSTALRTREFALRIALGAGPGSIAGLTLGHTARLTAAGAACGLGGSLVLGRILKNALYLAPHLHPGLIYGVSVTDPVLLAGVAGLLLACRRHRRHDAGGPRVAGRALRGVTERVTRSGRFARGDHAGPRLPDR